MAWSLQVPFSLKSPVTLKMLCFGSKHRAEQKVEQKNSSVSVSESRGSSRAWQSEVGAAGSSLLLGAQD